jgi:DNA repair protein RadC
MRKSVFTLSEIELRYHPKIPAIQRPKITSSSEAYDQLLFILDQNQINIKEEAVVLFMNRSNRVIGGYKLSSGGITGTVVDIRIILAMALKSLAHPGLSYHTRIPPES